MRWAMGMLSLALLPTGSSAPTVRPWPACMARSTMTGRWWTIPTAVMVLAGLPLTARGAGRRRYTKGASTPMAS